MGNRQDRKVWVAREQIEAQKFVLGNQQGMAVDWKMALSNKSMQGMLP